MAHEGVSGYGTFGREWAKFQKRKASTAESEQRARTRAWQASERPRIGDAIRQDREAAELRRKVSAGAADLPWWQTLIDYSPFGRKNVVTKAAVDPAVAGVKAAGGAISDLFGASKWVIVGLVALAAIVVVPRLLPGK